LDAVQEKKFAASMRNTLQRRIVWALALAVLAIAISSFFMIRKERPIALARTPPTRHATSARDTALPASTKPSAASPSPTTELCGLGRVSIDTDDPFALGRYLRRATAKARDRWEAALLDSDDNRARAAGLYLQGKLTATDGMETMKEASRDALVQIAVGAGDPAVYAIAIHACDTYENPAASTSCQQITLGTWANMDPSNAVPWLKLSGYEHTRGNVTAESEAFARASQATKVDAYTWSLFAIAEPQYRVASTRCAASAPQDRSLHDQCNRLAETFVTKGSTLIDFSIGIGMGTHSGWSRTRIANLRQERDALMQVGQRATTPLDGNEWGCNGVRLGATAKTPSSRSSPRVT
jgi:hypothetical protein